MRVSHLALIATLSAWPNLAVAQSTPAAPAADAPETDEPAEGDDIVVTGARAPGSVPGDIQPERQLSPADVRSYGVSSINDLLAEIAPQTTSGRGGAPVVLLGGRRISSFAEIRDIPTEAILRVDILPEEAALKLGYRADQKVVNFVLRRRFRAVTLQGNGGVSTEGDRPNGEGQANFLALSPKGRLNLNVDYQASSNLTESERDIPLVTNSIDAIDQRPFRTLLPSSDNLSANAVYARTILGNVAATINGRIEATTSNGLFGLPGVSLDVPTASPFYIAGTNPVDRTLNPVDFAALRQRNSGLTTTLGTTMNGDVGKWRWSLTGSYNRVESRTWTDGDYDAAPFQARLNALDPTADPRGALTSGDVNRLPDSTGRSVSNIVKADALFNGSLLSLPAGNISTSVRVGGSISDFDSRSTRYNESLGASVAQPGHQSRDIVNGQFNVDLPIASRSKGVLSGLGNLSANFNAGVDHLSDFGTLTSIGYGLNWSPIPAIRLIASITNEEEAPTAQQIGNPRIETPNVRVFDFVNGTNATITQISGGNTQLRADDRHITSFGLTLNPWSKKDLTFTANYTNTRIDNPIASFPGATAAIESAFPQRFLRDADGQLLQIDSRPINFAQSRQSQLRWGLSYSKPIKSKIQKELEAFRAGTGPNPFEGLNLPGRRRPDGGGGEGSPRGDGDGAQRAPGDGGGEGRPGRGDFGRGPGGGGRGGFGGGGQGGGRLNFAVYHTFVFTNRVTVAEGGPVIDLLNGGTLGSGSGQSRHQFQVQAGYSNNGLGLRLSGNYASASRADGGTAAAPQTLHFGGLATANLRLFADLGQRLDWVKEHPWLRGTRVSLSVNNITNSRQRVTDSNGVTPVAYAPDYLDPLGRSVMLTVRKLFF